MNNTSRTAMTSINTLLSQLKENPVNWALLAVLAYVVRSYAQSSKVTAIPAKHPEVMVFRNYTPKDLLPFDGQQDSHDASRGLAKNSFDLDMITDPNLPIDKLEDLAADEWESLREWELHFASKYLLNGRFGQLPDELVVKILGHLQVRDLLKATAVCQKWKRLAFDGSLWTKIDTAPFYKTIPAEHLLRLGIAAGSFLKIANFRGCIQLTEHELRQLSEHCPNIHTLCIRDCRELSTAGIGGFLQNRNLRVLDISGLDAVKNSTLQTIGRCLPELEKLNLAWCRGITGRGLHFIAEGCHNLRFLKLNGCPHLDEPTMAVLGQQLLNLTHLSFSSCTSLTDAALLAFLQSSTAPLTHLSLSNCARLSDISLRHLAHHCPQLTHLELAGCVLLTDQGFCYLASRIRSFVHLDLEDLQQITGSTVKSLANHQTRLRRLCLSNCTQITDDAITHLVLHGVCTQLHHLELDNCIVTDDVLDTIARFLNNQSNHRSTGASTKENHPRTLSVEVLDCSNITEVGVRLALEKAAPNLTIKSFYSWRYDSQSSSTTSDEEENLDHILAGRSRRYNTVGRHRRQRSGQAAGQPHAAANCIIL
ncbi:uncharacterized protein BYT42DRAFT_539090 [Radiomyces spectabilis]|uniref:uncharacterized protein n=1 Tax=Radiomyces spectabilis TaxID=64574 RepID=UPI00221FEC76|nr:uncharacterized protein BYT42DRAFT_539090 [Radiomyces spectabilis]KAI8369624.1 hypothetical protein BYT42DRAFT_539090 [Radiomyces spectabilis]